ncbi:uncharacterized protein LOC118805986 [Colossoma macropomum]|uniref:uncharacterized protein LOC118805986 n=1 Tax=Colossoma macropomum TaxID=42526 RepID=UPI001863C579|nr:uncharacterized protein LOC118805986 [Colossoma macropomum]XP_036423108.1 uncharacterized protein LOC118805986 [Colossoma macropomum]
MFTYFRMGKLLTVLSLVLLLSYGVESFTISEKDYENIDKMLEFGAQVFLNCLDKVRDVTERMVRENQLRSNRIAIQDHWNSFRESANRISVEERGKGEQDDLVVAARTFRGLVLFYKDDVQRMIRSLATEKGVQQYIPAVNMLEGIIQRDRLREIWGAVESRYFPEAPSAKNDPLEFLCYLLSTRTNILKTGDVILQLKKMNFKKLQERLQSAVDAIREKVTEFVDLEKQKEKDELLVSVSAAARVCIFYWDSFLEYTESHEFMRKVMQAHNVFEGKMFEETMQEMLGIVQALIESNLITEVFWLLADYFQEISRAVSNIPYYPFMVFGHERRWKTESALGNVAALGGALIWEKLYEMDVFSMIKQCYLSALDIIYVLAGEEDFETIRGFVFKHWRAFSGRAYLVIDEERRNTTAFPLPQVRASVRLLSMYSSQLVNENIGDGGTKHIAKNLDKMKRFYTEKLLARGIITQQGLEEFQRILEENILKLLKLAGERDVQDLLWNLYKASVVFLNLIYSRLNESWNFISV